MICVQRSAFSIQPSIADIIQLILWNDLQLCFQFDEVDWGTLFFYQSVLQVRFPIKIFAKRINIRFNENLKLFPFCIFIVHVYLSTLEHGTLVRAYAYCIWYSAFIIICVWWFACKMIKYVDPFERSNIINFDNISDINAWQVS